MLKLIKIRDKIKTDIYIKKYYPHATKSRHRLIPAEGLGELGEIVTIIEV